MENYLGHLIQVTSCGRFLARRRTELRRRLGKAARSWNGSAQRL